MEKLVTTMEAAVSYAVENDVPVMFVTEDTTRSNPDDVKMIYQRAMELGVRRLCVCDTCGHVTPNGVKKLLNFIDEEVIKDAGYQRRDIEVNWHGHQDRGLGVANNIAAVEAGADVIHGTALGVGERAGELADGRIRKESGVVPVRPVDQDRIVSDDTDLLGMDVQGY